MPDETKTEPTATGKVAEVTFKAYEGGAVHITCSMPDGELLDSRTFDLTGTDMLPSLNEVLSVLMLGLAVGLAPELTA